MRSWPEWWAYEIVLSPHLLSRMVERGFGESDLRLMLDDATGHRPSVVPGRFVIVTSHEGAPWEVIVEPDEPARALIVVTAYRVE